MSVGIRVVRGPDWNYGDKDGGEGHVGSIIAVSQDDSCDVVWDNGREMKCNIGKAGKRDLRVVDNAPAGVKHLGVRCHECKQSNVIIGTRWKCSECHDCDLCTICYYGDKHNLSHQFLRINKQSSKPIKLPKRATSQRMRALGIFPGAVVLRGKDWSYGTQDGGQGSEGKVTEIRTYGGDTGARNAVKVTWENGEGNVYKLGAGGKMDLKFMVPAVGTEYYRDHLDIPDSSARITRQTSTLDGNESSTEESETSSVDTLLHVGDRVCVFIPADDLKQVQRGRGGWSMRMAECIGRIGKVKNIESDEIIEVEYESNTWQFYQGVLRKVYDINLGDTVQILSDPNTVELLQKGHGGWEDAMIKTCGKIGKVEKIDRDGDVVVQFDQQVWIYSPASMIPAPGKIVDILEDKQDISFSTSRSGGENVQDDLADSLARLVANLVVLGHQQRLQTIGPEQMLQACAKGDIASVQQLLKMKKELVNCKSKDLTPLMIASHEGHMDIAKLLLDSGANINTKTSENSTALLTAAAGKQETLALFLVSQGATVKEIAKFGRSLAHHASYCGMFALLKAVLEKGCDPNVQDIEGDTALHDAIAKGHDRAVNILLSHPNINITLVNKKGFHPLLFAAFKENEFAVEKLLNKSQSLMKMAKSDGSSALHIAAINDHRQVASILILKGKANINLKDKQGLTPLHLACHEAYFDMVKLLIQNGADVNIKDNHGNTPLHLILGIQNRPPVAGLLGLMLMTQPNKDNDRFKTACLLMENEANIQTTNNNGKTPLQNQATTRVATGDPFVDFLETLLVKPCANCTTDVANAKFVPCGHKLVCEECSLRFNICPQCTSPVQARLDNRKCLSFI
ncbi:E3 ubiquitin-protein ligase MIB1-like [Mytilus galloprovincialis]|uniref:E3 ubiquitin-protein ligase MIB1-like n=1 Tax=Mytilus galloprovincialis TaxID=29158 RepID=UPI003F7C8A8A